MLKLLTFPGEDEHGNIFVQALSPEKSGGLTKTASSELHPSIAKHIEGIEEDPKYLYVLVNALGAGEYYGSNINGDYFEESELAPNDPSADWGHATFLKSGIYRHHKNKDSEKSMGTIVCSCYNPAMHRVELVLRIDRAKAEELGHGDLVDKLDAGEHPAVSMGCKVKYDVCSICGHKSKTRADYCAHTKSMMNKILPNGKKVFVYNPKPRFFDLSFVVIGADRTSYAMAKVASIYGGSSAALAEQYGIRDGHSVGLLKEKLAKKQKISNILKQVPAMSAKVMPSIQRAERDLPNKVLDMMGKSSPEKALTTASSAGIVLKPREYQRVILIRLGKKNLADKLDSTGRVFPLSNEVDKSITIGRRSDFSDKIRDLLMGSISNRSMFEPVLTKRITISIRMSPSEAPANEVLKGKFASIDITSDEKALLNKISASYNGYREQLLEKVGSVVADITSNDITLLSAINGSRLEDEFMGGPLTKTAKLPMALVGALPMAYLYGAHVKKSRRSGQSTGPLDRFIEKHPILATSVFVGLTRLGMGLKKSGVFSKSLNSLVAKLS